MSVELKDYEKLLSKEAWKGVSRLYALNIYSMEFEDVYQEMCISFASAAKLYQPAKGFAFTTYLVLILRRQFQRIVVKLVEERTHLTSVEEIQSRHDDGDDFDLYASIASDEPLLEDAIAHKLDVVAKLEALKPVTRMVLLSLIEPSEELKGEFNALQSHLRLGRELEVSNYKVPTEINLRFICEHNNIPAGKRRLIREELMASFGVTA